MKFSTWNTSALSLVLLLVTMLVDLPTGQAAVDKVNGGQPGLRKESNGGRGRNNNGKRGRKPASPARNGCEEIYLPMCKDLIPYTHTKLPNQFNHTTQLEVYRDLQHLWAYIDHSCSKNTRVLACATHLPKCQGRKPAMGPCKQTCMTAKRKCAATLKDHMGMDWEDAFPCAGLPNKKCVKPVKEERCAHEFTNCVENSALNVCANLTFTWGILPNMFQQCSTQEINKEIQQYEALMATNCHLNLKFLLCGVYSPFCIRSDTPFTFPCREICEEIRGACESHYRRLYHGLPWPQKLQCHRYPDSEASDIECVMPNEGSTFFGGR